MRPQRRAGRFHGASTWCGPVTQQSLGPWEVAHLGLGGETGTVFPSDD